MRIYFHLVLQIVINITLPKGTWVWLADHDLDARPYSMITTYAGRGILSESQGPVWMIGTGKLVVRHLYMRF
jgi:hypothetical protein